MGSILDLGTLAAELVLMMAAYPGFGTCRTPLPQRPQRPHVGDVANFMMS